MQKKVYTVHEILKKMEHYCAYQERCHQEVENKLKEFRLIPEAREHIILQLLDNNFLNEERFSKAFARGKFRIKKWGRQRIVRELKARNISEYNINSALAEIDHEEYVSVFEEAALKKLDTITEKDRNRKRKKLSDYLLYHGWESNLVYPKVLELIP